MMIKNNFLQKDPLVRKIKLFLFFLALLLIVDLVLILAFRLWTEMTYRDGVVTFVPSSPYRVVIQGEPAASGNLYWLGHNEYLLLLTPKSLKYNREVYYIDMCRNPPGIGLPNSANFRRIPFVKGALVEREVFEGYPLEGELETDWKVNDHEIRLRIKGFSESAQKAVPVTSPEVYKRMLPIAYQREIILRETSISRFVSNLTDEK
jgi:hypothetical protein